MHGQAYAAYAPELRRFLASRLGNEADAQDIAQEAYLRLTRVERPELIQKPASYLFRIASNLANELLLKRKNMPAMVDLDTLIEEGGEAKSDQSEAWLRQRAVTAQLEEVLHDLPPLYRAILLMRKGYGYSHKEIAERLEISPQTVHTYLKRALAQCRAKWSEYEE